MREIKRRDWALTTTTSATTLYGIAVCLAGNWSLEWDWFPGSSTLARRMNYWISSALLTNGDSHFCSVLGLRTRC